jgi:hypothetical protein
LQQEKDRSRARAGSKHHQYCGCVI